MGSFVGSFWLYEEGEKEFEISGEVDVDLGPRLESDESWENTEGRFFSELRVEDEVEVAICVTGRDILERGDDILKIFLK